MFADDFEKAKEITISLMPYIRDKLKADRIISFEDCRDSVICGLFDRFAGIDAVSIDQRGMRGIALRVQYNVNWGTFTVRLKRANHYQTEFEKRVEAIQKGYLYPYLTMQVYYDDNAKNIMSGAICRTEDLYEYLLDNQQKIGIRKCPEGNTFYYVPFELIADKYEFIKLGNDE